MATPILIFYHCLFVLGDPPEILTAAIDIVHEQMTVLKTCGLLDAASEMIVGVNGGEESKVFCDSILPEKAKVVMHGLACRNEIRTMMELEKWLPGHDDWFCLWFHSKGASHPPGDQLRTNWRRCMQRNVVENWRTCVQDLNAGCDAVGCHYMAPPKTPPGQYIFAGNYWFAKASFLLTLPSITKRERLKISGIDSIESRYEPEIILGLGPRLPIVRDYHPGWIDTCQP